MGITMPDLSRYERILGLDLSKKTFKCCILTKEKNFEDRKVITGGMTPEGRMRFASTIRQGDVVAMEGGTSSFNFARELEKNTDAEVIVLNPGKLHIIFQSQCKTDKQDAVKIAYYIRDTRPSNRCTVQIPSKEESELRQIVNSYNFMKEERTRNINKLHSIFNQNGIPFLRRSDLASNGKRIDMISNYLEGLAMEDAVIIEDQISIIESKIERYVEMMKDALREKEIETAILLSIPGIGILTAATMLAYVGDGSRFYTPAQLRNYVALVPRIDQSGDHNYIGGISSYGCKPIRKCIMQAALSIEYLANDCPLKDEWTRLKNAKKRRQTIAVHIANKILTIMWTLLRNRELYNGFGNNDRLITKLKREKLDTINLNQFNEKEKKVV